MFGVTQGLEEYTSCLKDPCTTNPRARETEGVEILWGAVLSAALSLKEIREALLVQRGGAADGGTTDGGTTGSTKADDQHGSRRGPP
ncbi:hypothetical protein ACTU45_17855 [Streptomyces sp. 24-1644]|uniref:hypothetical protein n=1 Tax=Streptomyces sp. 24-1644 TaxID=3457315 RepID=UPI003FA68F51